MAHIIGKTFEGMDKFTLKDLTDIKKKILDTKMTMKGFRKIMRECKNKYNVDEQTAFNVTQYCVINMND